MSRLDDMMRSVAARPDFKEHAPAAQSEIIRATIAKAQAESAERMADSLEQIAHSLDRLCCANEAIANNVDVLS